jgi:hypothetical protein
MSEGQSRRSVALSVQHRQEAEVAAAEEREQAAAETAATAARAARLAMAKLAAARAEVEAAAAANAARAAVADYYEDRRALDALIAAVSSEMQFSLSKKWTAKEAWGAIATARICSDRARKTTLQALHKEWENLSFKPGEDVDDFALHLNTLQ